VVDKSTSPMVNWLLLTAARHIATQRACRSELPPNSDISVMADLSLMRVCQLLLSIDSVM
jgi:hypothetical protein